MEHLPVKVTLLCHGVPSAKSRKKGHQEGFLSYGARYVNYAGC